jgi:adenosylcobinamide kinase/adenosylcobinamide-phosphate guanylyltransferase
VVIVTNEVGMGIVPERRSGRIFGDLLGIVNQRFAAECDEVQLIVAGRAVTL